jgi:hypothetical protein
MKPHQATAECNQRQAGKRVSYNNTNRMPFSKDGEGKYAGIGAKGGTMGKGGKRGY